MAFPVKDSVRILLGVSSALTAIFFLSKSSFADLQLSDHGSATLSFLTALLIVFLFLAPDLRNLVAVNRFAVRSMVTSFSFAIVLLLVFLIKHPRFNIHSEYTRPCVVQRRNQISRGVQYNLFAFIAFAVLASLISFKRKEPSQLGFSGNLLGLVIDTCMEINGAHGAIIWYVIGAGLCCISLIFIRGYAETSKDVLIVGEDESRGVKLRRKFRVLTFLEVVSATFGIALLPLGSLSKMQFEGLADLKAACLSVFALLLGTCLLKIPNWMDVLVTARRKSGVVKASVNSLLLMIVSLVTFLNKFPRFQVHSEYLASCPMEERIKIAHGSLFDLYSAGTFAFFALVVSAPTDVPSNTKAVDLGMFTFLLQLTMDVATETLENRVPNLFYMVGAFAYCVALICLKTWLSARVSGDGEADESSVVSGDRKHVE